MFKLFGADDLGTLNVSPKIGSLPGGHTASGMVGGAIFYALLLTFCGVVLSAGLWAVGSWSGNYTQSINGKKGLLICCSAALIIGGAYGIESWFYGSGQHLS